MKRILTLSLIAAVLLVVVPATLHAQSTTAPAQTTNIQIAKCGVPSAIQSNVDAQFAQALSTVVADSASQATIAAAKSTADTTLTNYAAAGDPFVCVRYRWTFNVYGLPPSQTFSLTTVNNSRNSGVYVMTPVNN